MVSLYFPGVAFRLGIIIWILTGIALAAVSAKAALFLKERVSTVGATAGAVIFLGFGFFVKSFASVSCKAAVEQLNPEKPSLTESATSCVGWSVSMIVLEIAGLASAVAAGANWNWLWINTDGSSRLSTKGFALIALLCLVL